MRKSFIIAISSLFMGMASCTYFFTISGKADIVKDSPNNTSQHPVSISVSGVS